PAQARAVAAELLDEPAQLVDAVGEIVAGAAHLDDREFLPAVYRAVLSRAPDPGGLEGFGQHLRAGGSRLDVIAQLGSSVEARARGVPDDLHARVLDSHRRAIYKRSMDASVISGDEPFVRALHLAALARAAGAEWIAENLDALSRGHSRADIAQSLAQSPEARALGLPDDWAAGCA